MRSRRVTAKVRVQCAIAGGGPTGMMLGWLRARAGVTVVDLEKAQGPIGHFESSMATG